MQFERTGNIIRFISTDGIDWNTWHETLLLFNYLGYDFEDETQVKEYFDRHYPLQEDQSITFLQIIGQEHIDQKYTKNEIEKANLAAKEMYGTTGFFKKAGYILTDGSMLDFSEGQWQRTLDHRHIENIIDLDTDNRSDNMYRFIAYGNIRLLNSGFHMIRMPTDAQWSTIRQILLCMDNIYVDISNENGHIVHHIEVEAINRLTFNEIKQDITDYFKSITL